jgi:hypothetical protein
MQFQISISKDMNVNKHKRKVGYFEIMKLCLI